MKNITDPYRNPPRSLRLGGETDVFGLNGRGVRFTVLFLVFVSLSHLSVSCSTVSPKEEDRQRSLVEDYLKKHINDIVPKPPVAGGSWRPASISYNDHTMKVDVEDGVHREQFTARYRVHGETVEIYHIEETRPASGEGSPVPPKPPLQRAPHGEAIQTVPLQREGRLCVDRCGDGICQEIVCMGRGCPCPESPATCPRDCKK